MYKVKIYIRLGKKFIEEADISSLKKIGTQTLINLKNKSSLLIDTPYEAVLKLLPSNKF
jgi:hypothetical protein